MGGRLAPPGDELMNPAYARRPDVSDLWWRNVFENPTTVQFDHPVLVSWRKVRNLHQLMQIDSAGHQQYVSTAALYA